MTLDQSLANLQAQADRLAGHFAAISDAIEAERRGDSYVGADPIQAYAKGVADAMRPTPTPLPYRGEATTEREAYVAATGQPYPEHATQTPQGAAPSSAPTTATSPAGAVEVEGQGVAAPEAPRPAAPTGDTPPWVTQAAEEPTAEKKSGRRTNEEIAAELGVDLDAVKEWKGGGRVSRKDMEEYKKIAASQAMNNQTLPEAAGVTTPPDGSHLPTQASNPFGNPGTPAPVAPPQTTPAPAPAEQVPWATAEPVQPPAQQQPEFGTWPAADGVNPSNPFGS